MLPSDKIVGMDNYGPMYEQVMRVLSAVWANKRDCQKQHRSLKNMVLREFAGSLYLGVRRTARTASDKKFVPFLKVITL